jgi:hypothetical protein
MTRVSRSVASARRLAARRPRVLALLVALLVGAASLGAFAPTAFGEGAAALAQAQEATTAGERQADPACGRLADPFVRTELFFGTARPDGSAVSEAEFKQFLDQEITPRFPDGLTLLTGLGQFRGSSGQIVQERSMLLILLYPRESARSGSQKIEEIRALYKTRFQQESVLRVDERLPACVSF